jgi:hypothetical protein
MTRQQGKHLRAKNIPARPAPFTDSTPRHATPIRGETAFVKLKLKFHLTLKKFFRAWRMAGFDVSTRPTVVGKISAARPVVRGSPDVTNTLHR